MTEFRAHAPPLPPIPDDLTCAQFILDRTHTRRPPRPAHAPWFVDAATGRPVFLEEIRARVWGLANALVMDYGVGNDDVVCIFAPNHVDFPVAVWAAHRLGAVACCVNPASTAEELAYALRISKSKLVVTTPASLEVAVAAAKEVGIQPQGILLIGTGDVCTKGHPSVDAMVSKGLQHELAFVEPRLAPGEAKQKVAFLGFSSGTTGPPKVVAIPHYSPIANVIQMAAHMGVQFLPNSCPMGPGDVSLGLIPFFHISGIVVLLHFMPFLGMTVVPMLKFGLEPMLQAIERFNVTTLFVVPPIAVLLTKHPVARAFDLSRIKVLISAAAPMTAELNAEVVKLLPNASVGQAYGMTEIPTSIALLPHGVKRAPLGSAGQLMPGVVARIVKPDGTLGGPGERGELVVKSLSTALGYLDAPEANKETFMDGWVRSGDEASIDKDNWVWVHDRIKELIKVRGFQVAPAELEGHLLSHPDVRDACVVGVPHEYSGEVPMAFVVLSESAAARVRADPAAGDGIKAAVAQHVADAKIAYKHLVGGVQFVDDIPKNPSGKILRRILRERAKLLGNPSSYQAKL